MDFDMENLVALVCGSIRGLVQAVLSGTIVSKDGGKYGRLF